MDVSYAFLSYLNREEEAIHSIVGGSSAHTSTSFGLLLSLHTADYLYKIPVKNFFKSPNLTTLTYQGIVPITPSFEDFLKH